MFLLLVVVFMGIHITFSHSIPNMDIAHVKSRVKAWEKSFKAEHGRDPTKEDIKNDTSDIGAHSTTHLVTPSSLSHSRTICPLQKTLKSSSFTRKSRGEQQIIQASSLTTATPTTITATRNSSHYSYISLPNHTNSSVSQIVHLFIPSKREPKHAEPDSRTI